MSGRASVAAEPLSQRDSGRVTIRLRNRQLFIPEAVVDGLKIQPTIGIDVRVLPRLRLSLDAQTIDNSGPGRQGAFRVRRTLGPGVGSGNFLQELTLSADLGLWHEANRERGTEGSNTSLRFRDLRLVATLTQARRSYSFSTTVPDVVVSAENRSDAVATLTLPFMIRAGTALLGLAPVAAFFPDDNALYFRLLPGRDDQFFGTALGISARAAISLSPNVSLWGNGFVPLSGRNTISRASGLPSRSLAYDAGFRLALNSALSADVFVSNALGDAGALALLADREYRALGTGISFLPLCGTCVRDLRDSREVTGTSSAAAAASLLMAGTRVPRSFMARVDGGSRGSTSALTFAPVADLSLGVFLDWLSGTADESELGALGAVTLLPRTSARAIAVDVLVAASRSNNVFINFLDGTLDAFDDLGLQKSAFRFGRENEREGEVYLLTVALPVRYHSDGGAQAWFAPSVTVVQRKGRQLTGAVAGAALPLWEGSELSAEVGAAIGGQGNGLSKRGREKTTVWTVAFTKAIETVGGEIVISGGNRVGTSPFHALRALADERLAWSAGFRFLR